MKIGIDCRALVGQKTGIGYYLWEILSEWGNMNLPHELVLYSAREFEVPPELRNSSVSYRKRIFRMRPAEAWMHTILPLQIRQDKPDVFWGPNYAMPFAFISSPSVLTVHDTVYKIYPQTMKKVTYLHNKYGLEHYLRHCQMVLVPSENTKADLVRLLHLRPDLIFVTPLGVSERRIQASGVPSILARYGLTEGSYVLTVGTLEPRKNLKSVIQAFQELRTTHNQANLVVVGAEGWGDLGAELKADGVKFLGYVPEEHLTALYHGAKLFVYAPLYEGFGLPPLEAMSCGTPVITSNCSSLPEVVKDAAKLCDPLDIQGIAIALQSLWQEENLRAALSEAGKRRASEMTWVSTALKTIEYLLIAASKGAEFV